MKKVNDVKKGWFVVKVRSNCYKKVVEELKNMVLVRNLGNFIFDVVSKKEYSGYVFINMIATAEALAAVLQLRNVFSFLGSNIDPLPLTEAEMSFML